MSLPKPPKKYSDLLDKSFWSVEDLFWILLGDFGFNNVIPIVQGEHQKYYEIEKKIKIAADQGLDLVEISPTADPPVCKVIDYKKFLYEKKRKEKEMKAKFKITDRTPKGFGPNG